MYAQLRNPPKVVLGPDCFSDLPEFLAHKGSRDVVVCMDSFFYQASAFVLAFVEECSFRGVNVIVTAVVPGEPTATECDRLWKSLEQHDVDCVVAIGGGSALDYGKALSASLSSGLSALEIGSKPKSFTCLPFIAVPTTSGSGSECTDGAVILDEETGLKFAMISDALIPTAVFLDPALTLSCPPRPTALAAIDAFTHGVESMVARDHAVGLTKGRTPLSTVLSRASLSLIVPSLAALGERPDDLSVRENLMYGSHLAGQALAASGLHAIHALAYGLAAQTHRPHGECLAKFLPAAAAVLKTQRREDFQWLEELLASASFAGETCSEQLEALIDSLGLNTPFADVLDMQKLVSDAIAIHRLSDNVPGNAAEIIRRIAELALQRTPGELVK